MKNEMPKHYWRIHNRVARRILLDTHEVVRHIIAHDAAHETAEYKWFEAKVNADAKRLYEDPSYYDNSVESWRYPR
jgi:hypothetical protein